MDELINSCLESLKAANIIIENGKEVISRENLPQFQEVWVGYVMPLEGKEVQLLKGTNRILKVDNEGLTRISINNKKSTVPKDVFEYTYNTLKNSKSCTIKRVDDILKYAKTRGSLSSSIVVGVLAQAVPFIERIEGSKGLRILLK